MQTQHEPSVTAGTGEPGSNYVCGLDRATEGMRRTEEPKAHWSVRAYAQFALFPARVFGWFHRPRVRDQIAGLLARQVKLEQELRTQYEWHFEAEQNAHQLRRELGQRLDGCEASLRSANAGIVTLRADLEAACRGGDAQVSELGERIRRLGLELAAAEDREQLHKSDLWSAVHRLRCEVEELRKKNKPKRARRK